IADSPYLLTVTDKGYGKRPDILQFYNDIEELAKQGATSFNVSEEHWQNPLLLKPGMTKQQLDELRLGWDLIIDIDGLHLDYSKLAAYLIIEALKFYDINNYSIKFSGNRGFHIGIPFEAFPSSINNQETKKLFPDAARILASYLKEMIREPLTNKILEKETIQEISNKINKEKDYFVNKNILWVSKLVDIDNVAISSRHMFRTPYSYHEKSGLISIPIKDNEILNFDKEEAKIENVKVNLNFLDSLNVINQEATQLMTQAFYWHSKNKKKEEIKLDIKEYAVPINAIKQAYFPPCISAGLSGLSDGKKRFLFLLLNFLKNTGYDEKGIETIVFEWNKRNKEPLRENYIQSQLAWSKRQKLILPQNCPKDKENLANNFNNYYVDLHICNPDNLCRMIRNPVQYAIKKSRAYKNK
ncbi:MAG: DNA primase small subunit domain-containing protein, partial [Nanoarchaeota archaeon]